MSRLSEQLETKLQKLLQNPVFEQFHQKIFKACFKNLLEDEPNFKAIQQIQKEDIEQEYINHAFNLTILMIVEFQRKNFVESEIMFSLQELGMEKSIIDLFIQEYTKYIEFIQNKDNEGVAERFDNSINFQKLVDVEWKQDFIVSNKFVNNLNKDVYYIDLKTLKNEDVNTIGFRCSLQQLTELVQKMNVALKNIEQCKM